MMNKKRLLSALIIGTMLHATSTLAQDVVYQWTDENGVVQKGEQPPEGVEAVPVKAKAPPPDPMRTPLAGQDLVEMAERCEAARAAESRACENDNPDSAEQCDASSASFAKKLAELPECVDLEAEMELRQGER